MTTMNLSENWQIELEAMLLDQQKDRCKRKVYICSPLRAADTTGLKRNMTAARFYMYYAMKEMNCIARAPHAYLPLLLSEHEVKERAAAMRFDEEFLENNDALFVCGTDITSGMWNEIECAALLRMQIETFDPSLLTDIRKGVTRCGGDKSLVIHNREHSILSNSPETLFREGAA